MSTPEMLHELDILAKLLPALPQSPEVAVGPGDDCAALDMGGGILLLAAVDQTVSGVHYTPDTRPERAGAKLLKRNASDIAAMGGVARWVLLATASGGGDGQWVLDFCRGAARAAEELGISLIGGDITALPAAGEVGALTILGTVPKDEILRRTGAKEGDFLCVTGSCGNSFASGHHLDFTPRLAEGRFLASHRLASSAIDISDGVLLDLGRVAAASGTGFRIDTDLIPLRNGAALKQALTDGEDYELLFTTPPDRMDELKKTWRFETPFTVIGRAVSGAGIVDQNGKPLNGGGYEH
ncbi:MAG: thiamine-phosphate kinase [Victivallaceae bacterium]|nr:thiamine-phosphate kinase [Victivallaceae bacterium]